MHIHIYNRLKAYRRLKKDPKFEKLFTTVSQHQQHADGICEDVTSTFKKIRFHEKRIKLSKIRPLFSDIHKKKLLFIYAK